MSCAYDLKIVPKDNIILRSPNEPITEFNSELHSIVNEMKEAMYVYGGVGLAAPQIGINKQIFVWEWLDQQEVINPVLELSKELTDAMVEGCLSIPDANYSVIRAQEAELTGFNMYGEPIRIKAIGHLARIFQHEFDHLNSMLISDYGSRKLR